MNNFLRWWEDFYVRLRVARVILRSRREMERMLREREISRSEEARQRSGATDDV